MTYDEQLVKAQRSHISYLRMLAIAADQHHPIGTTCEAAKKAWARHDTAQTTLDNYLAQHPDLA